jgi:hypothetical protein
VAGFCERVKGSWLTAVLIIVCSVVGCRLVGNDPNYMFRASIVDFYWLRKNLP